MESVTLWRVPASLVTAATVWTILQERLLSPLEAVVGPVMFLCQDLNHKNHRVLPVILVDSVPTGGPQGVPFGALPMGLGISCRDQTHKNHREYPMVSFCPTAGNLAVSITCTYKNFWDRNTVNQETNICTMCKMLF